MLLTIYHQIVKRKPISLLHRQKPGICRSNHPVIDTDLTILVSGIRQFEVADPFHHSSRINVPFARAILIKVAISRLLSLT